jgi:hypothetical protein
VTFNADSCTRNKTKLDCLQLIFDTQMNQTFESMRICRIA